MAEPEFEAKLEKAKAILEKLMDPNMTMSESVRAYESGMKELKEAQAILEKAEQQIEQIKNAESE